MMFLHLRERERERERVYYNYLKFIETLYSIFIPCKRNYKPTKAYNVDYFMINCNGTYTVLNLAKIHLKIAIAIGLLKPMQLCQYQY